MIIQWFPGHMAKAKRVIQEQMKVIDVVIELRDARIPLSSENPLIQELIGNKPKILVLNKADMADPEITKEWQSYFVKQGVQTLLLDSKSKASRQKLVKAVLAAGEPLLARWKRRGLRSRSIRTVILGIPNVGKSTLINTMAKGYVAHTANRAGKTRGQQWVKLAESLELMDTPGVLWPKFDDLIAARRLAATGAIVDEVFDAEEVVRDLLQYVAAEYPQSLGERYQVDIAVGDADCWLEEIAKRRGCLLPGGVSDLTKARQIILQDFRQLRLGKISLERP